MQRTFNIWIVRSTTRLPTRHPEGDKDKLDRYMVDVLNNLLKDYHACEFELAKELKVFGFQTKGFDCYISEIYIVDRGLYCRRTFTLLTRVPDLYYLYDLLRAMFCFREVLTKSLDTIQKLKMAKACRLEVNYPISYYMLRLPPSWSECIITWKKLITYTMHTIKARKKYFLTFCTFFNLQKMKKTVFPINVIFFRLYYYYPTIVVIIWWWCHGLQVCYISHIALSFFSYMLFLFSWQKWFFYVYLLWWRLDICAKFHSCPQLPVLGYDKFLLNLPKFFNVSRI